MKIFQGNNIYLTTPFIGRVDCIKADERGMSFLVSGKNQPILIRTGNPVYGSSIQSGWYRFENIDLETGDIIIVRGDGQLQVVYSISSSENSLFLTSRCNHKCVICAQPQLGSGDIYYDEAKNIVDMLEYQPEVLGITGGEPLLYKDLFLDFFSHATKILPETYFQVLTNGSMLSIKSFAENVCKINKNATYCVPLYGDNKDDHDKIVAKTGAFWKSIQGVYNLALYDANIEIRVVLFSGTIERIVKIAEFLSKNFPFVRHIAIMGIEMHGNAARNSNFFIDVNKFQKKLIDTANIFISSNINFSFYNTQLCTVPIELHKYCRQSISPWKIKYVEKCYSCELKKQCCGIFFSNTPFVN